MDLLHVLIALLDGALLLLIQALIEALAILLHGADLLLYLLLLAPSLVRVEGLAARGALHRAHLRPGLAHGLVTGAVLVALLGGCLGAQALPLLLARLAHCALACTLTGAAARLALAALPLLAAAATTTAALLRPKHSRGQRKRESKKNRKIPFHGSFLPGAARTTGRLRISPEA